MKLLDAVKKTLATACVIFTAVTLIFNIVLSAMGETKNATITVGGLWVLFLFAMISAIAALIFRAEKLHVAIRIAINFVVCYAAMYLCVFVIFFNTRDGMKENGNPYTPAQILVATVIFTVIYAVVIAVKLIVDAKKKKSAKTAPYTKQFKGM